MEMPCIFLHGAQFLVTIGTLVLGAYLAIKVFRINIPTLNQDRGDGRHRGGECGEGGRRRQAAGLD